MAAPAPTTRVTPVGTYLKDGYQALITFAEDTDVSFWEKSVTPPGFDGGESIDNTTMHNSTYRTMSSPGLITTTDAAVTVAYDPAVIDQIEALINVETTITIAFSDGSTVAFFGYLKDFTPGEMVDGAQPEATCTIISTNTDPGTATEEGPVYTSA